MCISKTAASKEAARVSFEREIKEDSILLKHSAYTE